MPLTCRCPHCCARLSCPDEAINQFLTCPFCHRLFEVPAPDPFAGIREAQEEAAYPRAASNRPAGRVPAWALLMLLVAVGILGVVIGVSITSRSNSPAGDSSPLARLFAPRPDFVLTAQNLFEPYCEDPTFADRLYKGRVLELSGTVATTGQDGKGAYFIYSVFRPHPPGPIAIEDVWTRIAVASASGVQGVRCYLADRGRLTELRPGVLVTLRGRCAGMPLDVELQDCDLVSVVQPKPPVQQKGPRR